jgi:oxygen-independent coproporphyrinogen-3 oxidase
MPAEGASDAHTTGRLGSPNRRQRRSASSWTQRTPAGLPSGMPGIGELIDGAMQHAAQRGRQSMRA